MPFAHIHNNDSPDDLSVIYDFVKLILLYLLEGTLDRIVSGRTADLHTSVNTRVVMKGGNLGFDQRFDISRSSAFKGGSWFASRQVNEYSIIALPNSKWCGSPLLFYFFLFLLPLSKMVKCRPECTLP
jgi:hypothetical protein